MIKVYWLDCLCLLNESKLKRVLPYLSEERQEKTIRLQTAERRAQSAAAGMLLRHLFGDTEYSYGANGKPYLSGRDDLFFSLSHSSHYVVCAVTDCEIGVDIEPISPLRPAVLRRCFTAVEQQWIGEDTARFARLWTMKEAYMKLTGTGLSVPAKDIALSVPPRNGYDQHNHCAWTFLKIEGTPMTICSQSEQPAEIAIINVNDLL